MVESPSAAAAPDLGGVLAELEALLPEAAPVIRPMRTQWREQLVRVVVLGEAKRGKSSLVNALLGRRILPTGVVPVTSVSTEVSAGTVDEATVRFADGGTSTVPLDCLGDYVAEDRNRGNHKGVANVSVQVAGTPWPPSVVFVDTPGTGAVEAGHDETARTSLRSMDVSLLVLTSDPPISARERALLAEASERSAATLVVLAKADLLAPPDLDRVVGYTADVVADALGGAVEVVAVSTLGDAPNRHPGIRRVADAVLEVAARSAERTLHRSLSRRIRELVDGELAEIDLGLALLGASTAEADRRAAALVAALAEIRDRARVSADLVRAGIRRLDAELDAGAKAEVRRLASVLTVQAVHSPSSEDEAGTLAGLVRTATEYAESWRRESAARLHDGISDVAGAAGTVVEAAVGEVRVAARELVGAELTLSPGEVRLPEQDRFFYITTDLGDAASALSAAVRHRLPGGLGRRRRAQYLREQASLLADRQVGRARGDLRLRLAEADRVLRGQVDSELTNLIGHLERGAAMAVGLAEQGAGDRDLRRHETERRRGALSAVLARLAPEQPSPAP